jgi:hypothetical protein
MGESSTERTVVRVADGSDAIPDARLLKILNNPDVAAVGK